MTCEALALALGLALFGEDPSSMVKKAKERTNERRKEESQTGVICVVAKTTCLHLFTTCLRTQISPEVATVQFVLTGTVEFRVGRSRAVQNRSAMARVRGVGLQASMLGALFFAGVQLACGDQFFQPAGALRGAQISAPALVPLADVPVYYDVPLVRSEVNNSQ